MRMYLKSIAAGLCLGIVVTCAAFAVAPRVAQAGLLVVVSDLNVTRNSIVNIPGFNDPGNRAFFSNVLGGGTNVLFSRALHAHSVDLDTYYEGLAGVTTTVSNAPVDSSLLSGVDLMVVAPGFSTALDYTAAEVLALATYLDGGGKILMVAEGDPDPVLDSYNDFLDGLGSSIDIGNPRISDRVLHGIAADPLTAGVSTFSFIAYNPLTGGTSLVTGDEGTTLVAVEGAATGVSEPSAALLLVFGIAGLGVARRKMAA
jgi:hypothetical protein